MSARQRRYRDELDELKESLAALDGKIQARQEELAALLARQQQLFERVLKLKIAKGSVLGMRKRRNADLHAAWHVIERELAALGQQCGESAANLYRAVEEEIPGLKQTTFRSYLHRIKKAKLIEKHGAYWFRSVLISQDEPSPRNSRGDDK